MIVKAKTLEEVKEKAERKTTCILQTTNELFYQAGEKTDFKGVATFIQPLYEDMYCVKQIPLLEDKFTLTVLPQLIE